MGTPSRRKSHLLLLLAVALVCCPGKRVCLVLKPGGDSSVITSLLLLW